MIEISTLNKDLYKPKDVMTLLGVSLSTVQKMTNSGRLVAIRTDTNRRLITRESLVTYLRDRGILSEQEHRHDVIYARVSSQALKERGDLRQQINTVSAFAVHQNPKDLKILSDVASGVNDNRKALNRLIAMVQNNEVERIFVLDKDHLARCGFRFFKAICDEHKTKIVIVNEQI